MIAQTAANLIKFIVNRLDIFKMAESFDLQAIVLSRLMQRSRSNLMNYVKFTWFIRFELGSEVIGSLMNFFATHPILVSSQGS